MLPCREFLARPGCRARSWASRSWPERARSRERRTGRERPEERRRWERLHEEARLAVRCLPPGLPPGSAAPPPEELPERLVAGRGRPLAPARRRPLQSRWRQGARRDEEMPPCDAQALTLHRERSPVIIS